MRARSTIVTLAALSLLLLTSCAPGRREATPDVTVAPARATTTTSASSATTSTTLAASTTTTTTTAPTSTTTTSTTTTTTTTTTTIPLGPGEVAALEVPLGAIGGADGPDAARLQQRLLDLGFWVAAVDGDYGVTTRQAVMAYQKYWGLEASGELDATTAAHLSAVAARPQPRSLDGTHVELDKDRQVLFLVRAGELVWVLNASSGSGQYYSERNQKDPSRIVTGRSLTPSGTFRVNRERPEGWWEGDLGEIYRPKYFNGGIAIHGSASIPNYPASHGCVRVSVPAMDMIWAAELVPKGTTVFVYGNDVSARNAKPSTPAPAPAPSTAPPSTAPAPTTAPPTTPPPDTTAPPPDTTAPPAPAPAAPGP